jgi:hypothetical protein
MNPSIVVVLFLLSPAVLAQGPLPPRYQCDGMASDLPCALSHVREWGSVPPVEDSTPAGTRTPQLATYPDDGGPLRRDRSSPMWGSDAPVEYRRSYVTPFGNISTNRSLGISSSSRQSMQFEDGTNITVHPPRPLKR